MTYRTPDKAVELSDSDFHETVTASPLPTLLEFWAPNCSHCLAMAPILDEIAGEYEGRVRVARMDVVANRRIPADFEVRGTPMFILFMDGRPVDRFVGAMTKSEMVGRIEDHIRLG